MVVVPKKPSKWTALCQKPHHPYVSEFDFIAKLDRYNHLV